MGDVAKGFAFGFGCTAGVIVGLYASFKGIEAIGYYAAKREQAAKEAALMQKLPSNTKAA